MAVIECPYCGAQVIAEDPAKVRSSRNSIGGRSRRWVMRERGEEIHHCSGPAPADGDLPEQ
ncbi:MAG: hypothetical protein QOG65_3883 [Actinomycetota bacterium]|jgi:hypothetical protein|nr:hypothetical protein [Actinomycetota bacterium]